jgi:alpha-tubulin suppressor-like RCC1 family protein
MVILALGTGCPPGGGGTSARSSSSSLALRKSAAKKATDALIISPSAAEVVINKTYSFSGAGGTGPYGFEVVAGDGTVNPATGLYTAPASAGSATVRVTDTKGATADAAVTIRPVLEITPTTKTLAVNNTFTFTATGGIAPRTFTVASGTGTVNSSSGLYTAPAVAGVATVRVTDADGDTADCAVTINAVLAISPTSKTLAVGNSFTFTASGGVAPYSFSVASGGGTIDDSSGFYTAPGTSGVATVRVTDSYGNTADSAVTINPALAISPTSKTMVVYKTFTFSASGGVPPYSYSVVAGSGSFSGADFTAPAGSGASTVRVTDSIGNTSDASVTTVQPTKVVSARHGASGAHTCALFNNGGVKCWGANASGQLGYDDANDRGDASGEMGDSLAFVNVGAGRYAVDIDVGEEHTCAILDNGDLKCWGEGLNGRLGRDTTADWGTATNTMASLTAINLGVGRTALAVSAGAAHTCAILDTGAVKCWGAGGSGRLGYDSTATLGDGAGEMAGLATVNLGVGRTAVAISAGGTHTCAVLDNGELKCWGESANGQLGRDSTADQGDAAGEMAALTAINLGVGRTAVDVSAGALHTCAILDNGDLKCFGEGSGGRLGSDGTADLGDGAGEMAALTAVNLGVGRTALAVSAGTAHTCAILDDQTVKCWGNGGSGRLGSEGTSNLGDAGGEMAALNPVSLGNSRTGVSLSAGNAHTCAVLDNQRLKCWGEGTNGRLGSGATADLGDAASEMGDSLNPVDL